MLKPWMCAVLLAGVFALVGCGSQMTQSSGTKPADSTASDSKHSGWWCDEHGVPESDCSMCSSKVAKAQKAKGDWCDKHERAKSICFKCDPSLKEKWAAVYRAKMGKEPPEPEKD